MTKMVNRNTDEERLARMEFMIESLQRESAAIRKMTAKFVDVIVQGALSFATVPTPVPASVRIPPANLRRKESQRFS